MHLENTTDPGQNFAEKMQKNFMQLVHDLNAPLASLEIIQDEVQHPLLSATLERLSEVATLLHKKSHHMLMEFDLFNHYQYKTTTVDLKKLIEKILRFKKIQLAEDSQNVSFEISLDETIVQLPLGPLERVLHNLIDTGHQKVYLLLQKNIFVIKNLPAMKELNLQHATSFFDAWKIGYHFAEEENGQQSLKLQFPI